MSSHSKIYCSLSLLTFKKINLPTNSFTCFSLVYRVFEYLLPPIFLALSTALSLLLYITDTLVCSEFSKSSLSLSFHLPDNILFTLMHNSHPFHGGISLNSQAVFCTKCTKCTKQCAKYCYAFSDRCLLSLL